MIFFRHKQLFVWSNLGDWDGQGMWLVWSRTEIYCVLVQKSEGMRQSESGG